MHNSFGHPSNASIVTKGHALKLTLKASHAPLDSADLGLHQGLLYIWTEYSVLPMSKWGVGNETRPHYENKLTKTLDQLMLSKFY